MRWATVALLTAVIGSGASRPVTFNRDVLPLLEMHCIGCHRAGGLGIMPLTTYQETRPWAPAIRVVVLRKNMPPWIAENHLGLTSGDKPLSPAEIETIVRWVETGAVEDDRPSRSGKEKKKK